MSSVEVSPPQRGRSVAIVMSRLRRLVIPDEPWLQGLRGVLRRVAADGGTLVLAEGTAGFEFLRFGAARLGIPCRILPPPADIGVSATALSVPDRLLIQEVDRVYALGLRPQGNIHRLLHERLERQQGGIVLVDLPGLQPQQVRDQLEEAGAEIWQPTAWECRSFPVGGVCEASAAEVPETQIPETQVPATMNAGIYLIAPFPSTEGWEFLTHTTRACPGPWPDQSFEDYAADLLESRPEADHSPLGALRRIVLQQKLIASGRTIRGGERVVSLTACPLGDLPSLHRFRPHRVRWDFEPFGLCLRREWLLKQGLRPVRYGDDADWESLATVDRPFFQRAVGASGIDWQVEQEWRVRGDLRLSELSAEDVILFVPDFESAKSLAEVTSWPMTLWPAMGRECWPTRED
jgi:hypothetical protein